MNKTLTDILKEIIPSIGQEVLISLESWAYAHEESIKNNIEKEFVDWLCVIIHRMQTHKGLKPYEPISEK